MSAFGCGCGERFAVHAYYHHRIYPDSPLLKDPYNFDFLTITEGAHEREIERGLLIHLRDLLLELGRGFSFVDSQVPLAVGEDTFYIDLLFYHLRLHAYIVIELKTGRFKPEWAGYGKPDVMKRAA